MRLPARQGAEVNEVHKDVDAWDAKRHRLVRRRWRAFAFNDWNIPEQSATREHGGGRRVLIGRVCRDAVRVAGRRTINESGRANHENDEARHAAHSLCPGAGRVERLCRRRKDGTGLSAGHPSGPSWASVLR